MLSPKMGMEAHTYNPFQNIILFRKPRQDDHEFKDSLGYIMRPCLKINEERKKERKKACQARFHPRSFAFIFFYLESSFPISSPG
jgi:hypothetical protein